MMSKINNVKKTPLEREQTHEEKKYARKSIYDKKKSLNSK